MKPCMKEWSPVTQPFLKSSFLDDSKPYRQKVRFWTINGINGRDKEKVNKGIAKIQGPGRIRTYNARRKAHTITTELKRFPLTQLLGSVDLF